MDWHNWRQNQHYPVAAPETPAWLESGIRLVGYWDRLRRQRQKNLREGSRGRR